MSTSADCPPNVSMLRQIIDGLRSLFGYLNPFGGKVVTMEEDDVVKFARRENEFVRREEEFPTTSDNTSEPSTSNAVKRSEFINFVPASVDIPVDDEAARNVFSNGVIWTFLGHYLTLEDLKNCRMVCRGFNRRVLDDTDFRSKSVVTISLARFQSEWYKSSREKWKNLSLDILNGTVDKYTPDPTPDDLDWLDYTLESIETIKFRRESEKLNSWKQYKVHPLLRHLLTYTRKLHSLSLDAILFQDACLHSQHIFDNFMNRLHHIKRLELVRRVGPLDLELEFEEVSVPITPKLREIKLSTDSHSSANIGWELRTPLQNFVRKTVMDRRGDLTELDLSYGLSWLLSCWGQGVPQFPGLKRLTFDGMVIDQGFAARFVMVQPLLEEIDLKLHTHGSPDFFLALQERATNLKILKLEFAVVRHWAEKDWWSFLRETTLKELELSFWNPLAWSGDLISGFLMNLPSTLQKFSLSRITSQEPGAQIMPEYLRSLDPSILTKLALSDCGDLVTDATVEFICRNFARLKSLDLSFTGRKVTDYGFTGITDGRDEPEFSIMDLKDLQTLKLIKCGAITDFTLCNIKFQELCYLDLSNNIDITHAGCRVVVGQNPQLRKLITLGMTEECERAEGGADCVNGFRCNGKYITERLFWEWGCREKNEVQEFVLSDDDMGGQEWCEYSEGDDCDVSLYEEESD